MPVCGTEDLVRQVRWLSRAGGRRRKVQPNQAGKGVSHVIVRWAPTKVIHSEVAVPRQQTTA